MIILIHPGNHPADSLCRLSKAGIDFGKKEKSRRTLYRRLPRCGFVRIVGIKGLHVIPVSTFPDNEEYIAIRFSCQFCFESMCQVIRMYVLAFFISRILFLARRISRSGKQFIAYFIMMATEMSVTIRLWAVHPLLAASLSTHTRLHLPARAPGIQQPLKTADSSYLSVQI